VGDILGGEVSHRVYAAYNTMQVCTDVSEDYYCFYLIELQMSFTRWQWYYNKTQHTKIHTTLKQTNTIFEQTLIYFLICLPLFSFPFSSAFIISHNYCR
jgi:hypothetical protein